MNTIKRIAIFTFTICFFFLFYFISAKGEKKENTYSMETFSSNDGWGYQISKNAKIIIYQPYIPCIIGNEAFPDEKSALNAGKLVLSKVKNQEDPTITVEELNKIMVKKKFEVLW